MALLALVRDFRVLKGAIESILQSILEFEKAGDIFASILRNWLKARLYIACQLPTRTLTMSSLLGMQAAYYKDFDESLVELLNEPLMLGLPNDILEWSLSSMIYTTGGQSVADELISIPVSAKRPMALVLPKPEDAFDVALKIFRRNQGPMYVLLDCKSAIEPVPLHDRIQQGKAKDGAQSAPCRNELTGEGQIAADDLLFVYMSYKGNTTGADGVAYLGCSHTQRFFGPLWEIHQALSSASG